MDLMVETSCTVLQLILCVLSRHAFVVDYSVSVFNMTVFYRTTVCLLPQCAGHSLLSQCAGHSLLSHCAGHSLLSQCAGHSLLSQCTGHSLLSQCAGHSLLSQCTGRMELSIWTNAVLCHEQPPTRCPQVSGLSLTGQCVDRVVQ